MTSLYCIQNVYFPNETSKGELRYLHWQSMLRALYNFGIQMADEAVVFYIYRLLTSYSEEGRR